MIAIAYTQFANENLFWIRMLFGNRVKFNKLSDLHFNFYFN